MHAALQPNPALARAAAATRPLAVAAPPPPHCAAKHGPYGASSRLLFQFKSAEDLAKWTPFSDEELGGHSSAALTLAEEPQARGAGMPVQSAALQLRAACKLMAAAQQTLQLKSPEIRACRSLPGMTPASQLI